MVCEVQQMLFTLLQCEKCIPEGRYDSFGLPVTWSGKRHIDFTLCNVGEGLLQLRQRLQRTFQQPSGNQPRSKNQHDQRAARGRQAVEKRRLVGRVIKSDGNKADKRRFGLSPFSIGLENAVFPERIDPDRTRQPESAITFEVFASILRADYSTRPPSR